MLAAARPTFTVEEAVESIGFGRFHMLLFFIMGSANVRKLTKHQINVTELWTNLFDRFFC